MHKSYPIQIWFLDSDLRKSAEYLTNKCLVKSISGCFQALICARFYFVGVRNRKVYKYYFDRARKTETMGKLFPAWSLKIKPSFMTYTSRVSKWTRKCAEHYDYIVEYLGCLLEEYEYRYNKPHGLAKFLEWESFDAPKLNIPKGNLKQITLEWKSINPRYRNKDIIAAYREQYKRYLYNDGVKISDFTRRDMPEFLQVKQDIKWLD